MSVRSLGWIPILLMLSLSAAGAAQQCHLLRYPPIPVTMLGWRPTIPAELNGAKTRLLVDTGAYTDALSPAEATEFKLPLTWAPPGYYISGGLGDLQPKIATVKTFRLGSLSFPNAYFLVGANDIGGGIAGVLGENLFQVLDVEFDFAGGVMRLIEPAHCDGHSMAYWAQGTGQAVSVLDLEQRNAMRPQLFATVQVNGHTIHAVFDTGATTSFLSLAAAKRAGVAPGDPGVVALGTSGKLWSAPIDAIQLGDNERIEHTHILVEDSDFSFGPGVWMFIGADFFLAHHVYLATSQSKLYFTYNGGPVFDLNPAHAKQNGAASAISALTPAPSQPARATASATPAAEAPAGTAADAAGLLRRGVAEASRLQFQQALADLSQACRLSPRAADCRYQRGVVYWRNHQPDLALQDFAAAIRLDPSDFQARLLRAEVRLNRQPPKGATHDQSPAADPSRDTGIVADARADLDAVDRLAPSESDLRLTLGRVYEDTGQYTVAIHQYDLWITYHPEDYRMAMALTWRCGSRARAGIDLGQALADCNSAYALMRPSWWSSRHRWPASWVARVLNTRSLIDLRQGNLNGTIADDAAAIKLQPDDAYARYERGLAELREGLKGQGQGDLAAAQKLQAGIAKFYAGMGLTP